MSFTINLEISLRRASDNAVEEIMNQILTIPNAESDLLYRGTLEPRQLPKDISVTDIGVANFLLISASKPLHVIINNSSILNVSSLMILSIDDLSLLQLDNSETSEPNDILVYIVKSV